MESNIRSSNLWVFSVSMVFISIDVRPTNIVVSIIAKITWCYCSSHQVGSTWAVGGVVSTTTSCANATTLQSRMAE